MFGIQTLISTGFVTMFTYVCVGAAVVAVAYLMYKAYVNHRRQRIPPEFHENNRDRIQRQQRIATYADSALELKSDAEQILTRVHNQQQQFDLILSDFDRVLGDIRTTNSGVDQVNHVLQDTVIDSLIQLLAKMKTEYLQISTLLTSLSSALDNTNRAFAEREKEMSMVVANLEEIANSANQRIQMVASEWPIIKHIQKISHKYATKIAELEKTIKTYASSLTEAAETNEKLLERVTELTAINEQQRSLLDLSNPVLSSSSEGCGRTSSKDYKLFSEDDRPVTTRRWSW